MFGYVKANRKQLKVCEDEIYKGAYCGLCKSLGRNYGLLSQFTLSYDVSFLTLLLLSIADEKIELTQKRCGFNPLKKVYCLSNKNQIYDYTTSVSELLTYYKILDNIDDSKGMKKFFALLLKQAFKGKMKKAAKKYPLLETIVKNMYLFQKETESKGSVGLDCAAHETANALGKIFSLGSKKYTEELETIGCCIGKFVYILDAADDFSKDKKQGSFNPLFYDSDIGKDASTEKIKAETEPVLTNCISVAFEAFSQMETLRFRGIIENILTLGLDMSKKEVLELKGFQNEGLLSDFRNKPKCK